MKRPVLFTLPLILAIVFPLNVLAVGEDWPDLTEDGLVRLPDTKLAVVYAEPGADLSPYDRVMLMEPTVAFRKNWERDQRSNSVSKLPTSSTVDINKIKKDLAREFEVIFIDTLNKGGYPVVDEVADDVLLVRPSIINLDINAPETRMTTRSTSYVHSAGEMTLYVELYDSVTGDLIAKALDRREDRNDQAMYSWANSSTNKAAAQRILKGWADVLLEALNAARSSVVEVEVVEEDVE